MATKHDADKPRYDLLPPLVLDSIVKVLTHGAKKYGDYNWIDGDEDFRNRVFAAMQRHAWAHKMGEVWDMETRQPHIVQAAVNAMFLAHWVLEDFFSFPAEFDEEVGKHEPEDGTEYRSFFKRMSELARGVDE